MRNVAIVDGEILTPLGDLEATWKNIVGGNSGVVLQQLGSVTNPLPLATIDDLTGDFGSWVRLESMFDHILLSLPSLPPNTLLFCATTKGAVDELLTQRDEPQYGQPWQITDYLANRLGMKKNATMVSAACTSGLIAIIQGAMNISLGKCDHALIIAFDLLADFVVTGFDSLKALSPEGAKPFDRNRRGLSLGDGAGWVLLSADEFTRQQSPPLAWLESWDISCDATHITAPCRRASGLKRCLRNVFAGTEQLIGGINAHGTATVYNDAMELLAFQEECTPETPVCSVKGALGHSLGAAGLVETMLSCLSLKHMVLPPTVGLEIAEESHCLLSGTEPLRLFHPTVLTCNSGFGGINAALLLTEQKTNRK